jgi:hypothetical protein
MDNNEKIIEPLILDEADTSVTDGLTEQYKKAVEDKMKDVDPGRPDGRTPGSRAPGGDPGSEGDKEGAEDKGDKKSGEDKDDKGGKKKKFRLKLERFARMIADGEKIAYNKLKAPYREEYYTETTEDVDEIIQNRLEFVSEYGDILNLVFDLVGHAVSSGIEMQSNNKTDENTKNSNVKLGKWF